MKKIICFFILIIFFSFSFSLLCIDNIFDSIFINSPRSFKVGPKKEICYKYKLSENKNKISLTFLLTKSYTAEVVIYKSLYEMEIENGNYINTHERYLIVEHSFKEIDVKDFYDYVYIIIRDTKFYYFNDYIILYDSEIPITLKENQPIEIANFMSNNKYIFTFSSNKNLQFVYSTNSKSQKFISVEYGENTIINKKIDNIDIILNLENQNESEKLLKIYIEKNSKYSENQEFSLVVYQKSPDEFIKIEEDDNIKINYIKNDLVQNFYFYSDISKYTKFSTINFRLDYYAKSKGYINITSDIIYSDELLKSENFINLIPAENKIKCSYDLYSDEYLTFYFNDNNQKYKYKYIIMKIEITNYTLYYNPKFFIISLSREIEIINLKNVENYITKEIKKTTNSYIPFYFKLLLDPKSKYIFTAPYQDYIFIIKGDLLINNEINKNYLDDQKDIIILSELSELTVKIFGNQLKNAIFYVEKIEFNDVIIMENERDNNEISIKMNEEECKVHKKKYILGTYVKEIYENGAKRTTKYWTTNNGEMNLYYKNYISLDNLSLFPSLENNKKSIETAFILNNHLDLFTLTCSKPGTFYLKPIMKTFSEKTHIIGQNSISTISLNSKLEILQLTSPIKSPFKFLYLSILPINGDNITISPDTPGVFDETIINKNELFTQIIDINKHKSDQLAIKLSSNYEDDLIDLEIIEVIHYNFSEYIEIKNNKNIEITKNNFIKFINKDIKSLKINIDGLNQVQISYGIVKLSSNDINFIPLAYNFRNDIYKKNITNGETVIDIDNQFYGKDDNIKKYQAFIFSIQSSKSDFKYKVKIEENNDKNSKTDLKRWVIGLIIIFAIITFFIILIVILIIKKKRGLNIENIKDNQPLYPNKKYILNDIMEENE